MTKEQDIRSNDLSVTRPRGTSAEITPFKLSVFRAIHLYAEVLEEFSCLLRAHCFESSISEPGWVSSYLRSGGRLGETIHVKDLPPSDPFLPPLLPILVKLCELGC
jgi:hypothetical protein